MEGSSGLGSNCFPRKPYLGRRISALAAFYRASAVPASLSNAHRHAQSPSADVRFAMGANEAKLEVKDHGKRIDPEGLRRFNHSGTGAGIGLAGMRERLRELGGCRQVESDAFSFAH
jgi:signal transduction histidine kinase